MEFKQVKDDVYFKCGEMGNFSYFGKIYSYFKTDSKNQYEIKKFNFDTGEYKHTNEKTEFTIMGEIVAVIDGFAVLEPTTPPIPQPTEQDLLNAEILLNQTEQSAKLKEIDEAIAVLLINQNGGM